jgi:tetratricopeptide (TPR) repeat protein
MQDVNYWIKYSCYIHIAQCYDRLKDEPKKVEALCQAAAYDPKQREAFQLLGIYYYEKGDYEAALPFFMAASKIKPPLNGFYNPTLYNWETDYYLCLTYAQTGHYQEALSIGLQLLQKHQNCPLPTYNINEIHKAMNHCIQANLPEEVKKQERSNEVSSEPPLVLFSQPQTQLAPEALWEQQLDKIR